LLGGEPGEKLRVLGANFIGPFLVVGEQLIEAEITHLDAILMTHPHADHTNGIDDVRPLVLHQRRMLDIHMDEQTSASVRRSFGYIFETPEGSQYPPLLREHRLRAGKACRIEGVGGVLEAMPLRLDHGEIESLGFRFGNVAYTPDVKSIFPETFQHLEGLDLWIIDALRYTSHPTHFCLSEALEMIRMLRPKRAILTHFYPAVDEEEALRLCRATGVPVERGADGHERRLECWRRDRRDRTRRCASRARPHAIDAALAPRGGRAGRAHRRSRAGV
jgi:phosphoribosyl 1,2-cyclic phosphate phosphodiesterase